MMTAMTQVPVPTTVTGYSQRSYGSRPDYRWCHDDAFRCPYSLGRLLQGHSRIPHHHYHRAGLQHQRRYPHRGHLLCRLPRHSRQVQGDFPHHVGARHPVYLQVYLYINITLLHTSVFF